LYARAEWKDGVGCVRNFSFISLSLEAYSDKYGKPPPASIRGKDGKPAHSWRVLILPFLGEDELYSQYRFDEPWNGPHNIQLATRIPSFYKCPLDTKDPTTTSYCAIVRSDGEWHIGPFLHGTLPPDEKNPILVVEVVDSGICWLEPRDLTVDQAMAGVNKHKGVGISGHRESGAFFTRKYGGTELLPIDTTADQLRSMMPGSSADSPVQK
jgi:hypothetical protein